ncbi:MAG: aminopeptidase P family protein, partial [Candidatus Dadabacteria bacterium]
GKESALIVSSASPSYRSLDVAYPYRQSSNFYYLTGSRRKNSLLFLSPLLAKPLFFYVPQTEKETVWEGEEESGERVARRVGAKALCVKNLEEAVIKHLAGHYTLFFDYSPFSLNIVRKVAFMPPYKKINLPKVYATAEILLAKLRLIKDREEIELIKNAGKITWECIKGCLPLIKEGTRESNIKSRIESLMREWGAYPAFDTIVAAGKSAAVLHYTECSNKLKNGEMVLIDCGAEKDMYCADITRVFPVNKKFQAKQRILYNAVLTAQKEVIKKIKPGVSVATLYNTAVEIIAETLIELGVLKGGLKSVIRQGEYKQYFPHGIGHSLGIDVHDIGEYREKMNLKLEKGMVITVEPGVYFLKPKNRIAALGIRIEDDVLVTPSGSKVLTSFVPKELEEIESLF